MTVVRVGSRSSSGAPPPSALVCAGAPAAGARPRDATVVGGLSKDVIAKHLQHSRKAIRRCFKKSLAKNSTLAGKLTVAWVIGADGKVSRVEITQPGGRHPALAKCIGRVVERIAFSKPKGGGTVTVNYPFLFKSGGRGGGAAAARTKLVGVLGSLGTVGKMKGRRGGKGSGGGSGVFMGRGIGTSRGSAGVVKTGRGKAPALPTASRRRSYLAGPRLPGPSCAVLPSLPSLTSRARRASTRW